MYSKWLKLTFCITTVLFVRPYTYICAIQRSALYSVIDYDASSISRDNSIRCGVEHAWLRTQSLLVEGSSCRAVVNGLTSETIGSVYMNKYRSVSSYIPQLQLMEALVELFHPVPEVLTGMRINLTLTPKISYPKFAVNLVKNATNILAQLRIFGNKLILNTMLNGIWQAQTGAITVNFLAETRYTFAFIIVDQNHIRVLMDSFDVMTYKIPVLLANEANTMEVYCNACQVHTISIANNTVH